ncbi:hypothetical protein GM708_10405 [Vibrio cholerae]|nr:hypothetical protein [Vibrio cholerae]
MHDNTPDGADGMFRPQLQSAMALAGRLSEMLARQRAERNEEMVRAEGARRQQLEERFEAERAVMRTQLGAVHQPQFWEGARPEDIAAQYALAQQWEPFDDMARLSREHIHDEIRTRYKLTPEEYLQANGSPEVEQAGEQVDRAAQRDHTEAEQQAAASSAATCKTTSTPRTQPPTRSSCGTPATAAPSLPTLSWNEPVIPRSVGKPSPQPSPPTSATAHHPQPR